MRDILENLLAGILLLFRAPFPTGDEVDIDGTRGTVQEVNLRETVLRTYDGRRVLIPNATVYKNAIVVQTAYPAIRTRAVVGVAYGTDVATARELARKALEALDLVLDDPAPQVLVEELGSSTIDLNLSWWSSPRAAASRANRRRRDPNASRLRPTSSRILPEVPVSPSRSLAAIAVLGVAAGAFTLLPGAAPKAAAETLVPYASCDELLAYYRAELVRTTIAYDGFPPQLGLPGRRESTTAAAAQDSAGVPDAVGSGPTGTNVQERGVDEPDSAKLVGDLLFAVSGDSLQIVRTGAAPQLLSTLPLDAPAYGAELLVQDDRALVLLPGAGVAMDKGDPVGTSMPSPIGGTGTRLLLIDIADPAEPRQLESLDLDGRYLSARLSGGAVRLVTASTPALAVPSQSYGRSDRSALEASRAVARSATLAQVLPQAVRRTAGGAVLSEGPAVGCGQVRHASSPQGAGTLLVTTLDLTRGLQAQDSTAVTTDGDLVYASADRLYVATSRWGTTAPTSSSLVPDRPGEVTTELHAFDTTAPTATRYAGSGSVAGYVYGRWALSSYDGHLRVATTSSPPWGDRPGGQEGQAASSQVTVLAERADGLVETGRVDGLGKGERIYAVRYFGDLATVVTFRQTDPLYVLDLGDPGAPKLLGELKVPGFSTYLHPVGGDRLLGVGQDADASGRVTGLQVSLFDLSDLSRPVQLDRLPLGTGHSLALEDSRAFGYDPERRLALLPMSTYDEMTGRNEAVGVRVGTDGSLARVGRLALGPDVQVERVLHDSDHVYAVTRAGVVAARAGDFGRTGSVTFAR